MKQDTVWQGETLTKTYLEGVRGAIPQAQVQIDVMLRLIAASEIEVTAVLDLGLRCDGILGQLVLDQYPAAHGIFVDFSAPMLAAAKKRLAGYDNVTLVEADYGQAEWPKIVNRKSQIVNYDVIVSGYSIHHQPDGRKQETLQRTLRPATTGRHLHQY